MTALVIIAALAGFGVGWLHGEIRTERAWITECEKRGMLENRENDDLLIWSDTRQPAP